MIDFTEFLAAFFGFVYIVLIILEKPFGWLFGFLSSLLYIEVCYRNDLFIQTGLQSIYALVGIFGFFRWKFSHSSISAISNSIRIGFLLGGAGLSFFLGQLLSNSNQVLPYLDATISIFGLMATYLTTEKRIENWVIWMIINLLSIYLYAYQGLYVTVFLYVGYFLLSIWGYLNWKKEVE